MPGGMKSFAWIFLVFGGEASPSKSCGVDSLTAEKLEAALSPCGVPVPAAAGENIECSDALPFAKAALKMYSLTTQEQVAFYISIMAIESGNLSYNRNHYPGRIGQGTRSMMMPNNLFRFLKDNPKLDIPSLSEIAKGNYDDNNSVNKQAVLSKLKENDFSFLPGAWWIREGGEKYQTSCKNFATTLVPGVTTDQINSLLSDCIGVTPSQERIDAYNKAFEAIRS